MCLGSDGSCRFDGFKVEYGLKMCKERLEKTEGARSILEEGGSD